MRSLQKILPGLAARGVKVVAVSVDAPEVNKRHAAKQGYTFPLLSDPTAEVIRRYDLLHAGAYRGADIARPAEFLIDGSGIVLWRNLTEDYKIRLSGEQVLEGLDRMKR